MAHAYPSKISATGMGLGAHQSHRERPGFALTASPCLSLHISLETLGPGRYANSLERLPLGLFAKISVQAGISPPRISWPGYIAAGGQGRAPTAPHCNPGLHPLGVHDTPQAWHSETGSGLCMGPREPKSPSVESTLVGKRDLCGPVCRPRGRIIACSLKDGEGSRGPWVAQ